MTTPRERKGSVVDCDGKRSATPFSQAEWFTNRMVPSSAQMLRRHGAVLLCFLFSIFCFRVSGQSYSIDWYKIAGGGGTSTNGQFAVSGTIGQPDASGAMTGGGYSLTGGFWSLYAVQTPGAPLLAITLVSNQAIVSWPSAVTGWTLQTNNNLATPNWGNYLGNIVNNRATNAAPTGNVFFRLKQ